MPLNGSGRRVIGPVLTAAWVAVVAILLLHTLTVRALLQQADSRRGMGEPAAARPLVYDPDSQTWMRYARQLAEGNDLRLRQTMLDNAPDGRDVYWNSAWAWGIAGAGRLWQAFSPEPLATAIARAALWLNFFVLSGLALLFSLWTSRRAGVIGGVAVALGMVGSNQFFIGFLPSSVDHHGLLTAAVFGLVLGIFFMGAGWHRLRDDESTTVLLPGSPAMARRAAVVSAACGAGGLWISAASVFPAIVLAALAGLATGWVLRGSGERDGVAYDADCWRLWGRVGAALSLLCYLAEFAPDRLFLRLEVNHPLYALAWLGGGELVAELTQRLRRAPGERSARPWRLLLPFVAIAPLPLALLTGGASVFVLRDPLLQTMHRNIIEFRSPLSGISLTTLQPRSFAFVDAHAVGILGAIPLLAGRGRRTNAPLWFAFFCTIVLVALGLWQRRWLMNASGPQICLTVAIVAALVQKHGTRLRRNAAVTLLAGVYLLPALLRLSGPEHFPLRFDFLRDEVLYRDIAATIRASMPAGNIVLLTDRTVSTPIGYYGDIRTIGTLYWENSAGLKAAAAIFSACRDRDIAALLRARRITHIAVIPRDPVYLYYARIHPEAVDAEARKSFGYRLIKHETPPWLQPLPYNPPAELQPLRYPVSLYRVALPPP